MNYLELAITQKGLLLRRIESVLLLLMRKMLLHGLKISTKLAGRTPSR